MLVLVLLVSRLGDVMMELLYRAACVAASCGYLAALAEGRRARGLFVSRSRWVVMDASGSQLGGVYASTRSEAVHLAVELSADAAYVASEPAARAERLLGAGAGVTHRYADECVDAGLVDAEDLRGYGPRGRRRRWYLA